MTRHRYLLAVVLALSTTACVSKSTHEAALASAEDAKQKETSALNAKIAKLHKDIDKLRADLAERDAMFASAAATAESVQMKLDEQTAINQKLSAELSKLGKDVDQLLKEGGLGGSIAEAKKRLAELRKAQAAAEARAALYKDLTHRLQKMIDAGDLTIELRDGRMVLALPNDVLFDSGKAELKPAGQATLENVAAVIKTVPRKFQVAGHTDNEPIKLSPYASNWELSTARSLSVVNFLLSRGVPPTALSAAGYGEFDPVAPNTTPKGREKNRRIEITVQTKVDELVTLPQ